VGLHDEALRTRDLKVVAVLARGVGGVVEFCGVPPNVLCADFKCEGVDVIVGQEPATLVDARVAFDGHLSPACHSS
jgi:hypothetical protein